MTVDFAIRIKEIVMDFGDGLPCGGFEDEDHKIQQDIKAASQGQDSTEQLSLANTKDCLQECGVKCEEKCSVKVQSERGEEKCREGGRVCKKCGVGRAVLLQKGEAICRECLFKNIEYKVRLLLENTFKVKKDTNVLVCLSGGLNSICLLQIMVNLQRRYQKNKLFNRLACVHVQQQGDLPQGYPLLFQELTDIPLVVLNIQDALQQEAASLQHVRALLTAFNKNADSVDLLKILRDRLITDYAQKEGFGMVLKGLNGETLATEVFRYFAKGLGGNLPLLSGGEEGAPFYYPLRNNLQKEMQYFYHVNGLSRLAIPWTEDNVELCVSAPLDGQIRQFVGNLQAMYSHTAPAIVRTAEKIQSGLQGLSECQWCRLPHDQPTLCRRCSRLWEGRKDAQLLLPPWMSLQN